MLLMAIGNALLPQAVASARSVYYLCGESWFYQRPHVVGFTDRKNDKLHPGRRRLCVESSNARYVFSSSRPSFTEWLRRFPACRRKEGAPRGQGRNGELTSNARSS